MSHLASIGFAADTEESFREQVQALVKAKKGETFFTGTDAQYLALHATSGGQLWLQVSDQKEILGFRPHFFGKASMEVTVESSGLEEGSMSGIWRGQCTPNGGKGKEEKGLFPLAFDCPDYLVFVPPILPWYAKVQLTAFVERMEVLPAGQGAAPVLRALTAVHPERGEEVTPLARIQGQVVEASVVENQLTGQEHGHALLETHGGTLDVVWPAGMLERLPQQGETLRMQAWLSGRFIDRPRLRGRGLGGLLFGKR